MSCKVCTFLAALIMSASLWAEAAAAQDRINAAGGLAVFGTGCPVAGMVGRVGSGPSSGFSLWRFAFDPPVFALLNGDLRVVQMQEVAKGIVCSGVIEEATAGRIAFSAPEDRRHPTAARERRSADRLDARALPIAGFYAGLLLVILLRAALRRGLRSLRQTRRARHEARLLPAEPPRVTLSGFSARGPAARARPRTPPRHARLAGIAFFPRPQGPATPPGTPVLAAELRSGPFLPPLADGAHDSQTARPASRSNRVPPRDPMHDPARGSSLDMEGQGL